MAARQRLTRLGVVSLLAMSMAGCGLLDDDAEPVGSPLPPTPLAIALDIPESTTIGVIVSSSGPGAGMFDAAEGAALAAFRLNDLGTTDRIRLEVRDDKGSAEIGREAVDELAEAGVAGIVYASSGAYIDDVTDAAADAGVPVVRTAAPHAPSDVGSDQVWTLAPSNSAQIATINDFVAGARQDAGGDDFDVVLLTTPGASITADDIDGVAATTDLGSDPTQFATLLRQFSQGFEAAAGNGDPGVTSTVDAFVVSADTVPSADIVGAIQQLDADVPIVLTTAATRPGFSQRLVELETAAVPGASVEANVYAPGSDSSDLSPGAGVDAFFESLLLAVRSEGFVPLIAPAEPGDEPRIGAAGMGAHDAVVLLAAAATAAESADPALVGPQLPTAVELGAAGLAGPVPQMEQPSAFPDRSVVMLRAAIDLGTRRHLLAGAPALAWYPATVEA